MEKITAVLHSFDIRTNNISVKKVNKGHINDTYTVYSDGQKYILQKVNTSVFKDPEKIMHNIDYIQKIIMKAGQEENELSGEFPEYLYVNGKNYLYHDGFWRIYRYLESVSAFPDKRSVGAFGSVIGKFHRLTENADTQQLYVTAENFHNIEKNVSKVLDYSNVKSDFYCRFLEFYSKEKKLLSPPRLVHNDVKWENVLINPETYLPYTLIDYDTVMTGYAAFDFGDAVRSACTFQNREIDIEMLESFAAGYYKEYGKLSGRESALGILAVTTELSARYLCDCLSRENYFTNLSYDKKIERHSLNLCLAESILNNFNKISAVIEKKKLALRLD